MRALGWFVAVGLAGGCYDPGTEVACSVACNVNPVTGERPSCPANLLCSGAGLCTNPDGSCPGTTVDANVTLADGGMFCYGTAPPGGRLQICLTAEPPSPLIYLANQRFNTNTPGVCVLVQQDLDPDHEVCVIAASLIEIPVGVEITFVGSRPVVLLGVHGININGLLDLESQKPTDPPGAGGLVVSCLPSILPTTNSGGAGGSGTGRGGHGGNGNSAGVGGASSNGDQVVPFIVGGCAGQKGGGPGGGLGGPGGGAVYLIATNAISVGGTINASGGPGDGGGAARGGGGAGAGGLIAFDSPMVQAQGGFIVAHGGGGGCGGGTSGGAAGAAAIPSTPQNGALGCKAVDQGQVGGSGSYTGMLDGARGGDSAFVEGGGGGGGAAGAIRIIRGSPLTSFGTYASPAPAPF